MGINLIFALVCVCFFGVFQLSEAACGKPRPECIDDSECQGNTTCLRKSPDEPKRCYPCPCHGNGVCIMENKKVKCSCNAGLSGHQCECQIHIRAKDCAPSNVTDYSGQRSITKFGRRCQLWASQFPHPHSHDESWKFPMDESVAAAEGYCRNPDSSEYLWCYTTDPTVEWEKCDVPSC